MKKIEIIARNVLEEIKQLRLKRDSSIVLFGSWFGNRFADNSRYLFQYLSENKEKYNLTHVVWVTRDKELCCELIQMGYEAYMMESEESIRYHKKAKFHIISNSNQKVGGKETDILTQYSNGAIRINLWHGIGGIKGVGYASKTYLDEKEKHPVLYNFLEKIIQFRMYRLFVQVLGGWGDCYYLSTTPFVTEGFKKYFKMPDEFYIESGYPRNQYEVKVRKCEKKVIEQIGKCKKTILYMPTFRDNNEHYISPLSNEKFINYLKQDEWTWIEKKHGADISDLLREREEKNIIQLDGNFDASIIIPRVDIVITDYSSVSWDALYHKKPVIFFMPDFDYYMKQDRGFVLKPEEFLIGPAVYSTEELLNILKKHRNSISEMIPDNEEEIFEKIWGREKECSEIWEDICKKVL